MDCSDWLSRGRLQVRLEILTPAAALIADLAAAQTSRFTVKRDTNISHWLFQSNRRGEARRVWFTREDVAFLAGLGFDHLRIPIDQAQMWDAAGQPDAGAFGLMNVVLGEHGIAWATWDDKGGFGLRRLCRPAGYRVDCHFEEPLSAGLLP